MKRDYDYAFAWAWELEDGSLCHWAEPTLALLREHGKPSPGARAVCVKLIRNTHRKPKGKA